MFYIDYVGFLQAPLNHEIQFIIPSGSNFLSSEILQASFLTWEYEPVGGIVPSHIQTLTDYYKLKTYTLHYQGNNLSGFKRFKVGGGIGYSNPAEYRCGN